MSPYATGGGGVTFERKVAVRYLARLLLGHGAGELGDGRHVVSVAFQQAPEHPVDDLVVSAARSDEQEPSLVLAVAVRRAPKLVSSDESTQKLVRAFVDAVIRAPTDGPEHRWCLVVAGRQPHAEQLAILADLAAIQTDAHGFFYLVRTPDKFDAQVRGRLGQIENLVQHALHDLDGANTDAIDTVQVQQQTWRLLAGLSVSMPRLEAPDDTDWAEIANSLIPVARDSDLAAASRLRDRLVTLAAEYSPKSAQVDLTVLRRDAHNALDPSARRDQQGWLALDHLHHRALASVHNEIKEIDGDRRLRLDRSAAAAALAETVAGAAAVVVSGESGVGKSALALGLPGTDAADPDRVQALCINLRHVHKLTVEFEKTLGSPLSTLLCELSAPQRTLVIDGADAVAEGSGDALRYLVDAAHASDTKVVAVASVDNKQVARDTLAERFGADIKEYAVAPLTDAEIDEIVTSFEELAQLRADPRPLELLRRLVVVDLLVRGRVSGVPLSDADAMREVWSGLVRRREIPDRGSPDARESVLLRLAALALDDGGDVERLDTVQALDSAALHGLHQDGLLRAPADDAFGIGPEFGHDEVRRYAVARLLLAGKSPASRIKQAGAPRWSLAAARLACQALLAEPDGAANPLRGRFAALQASFDAIVAAGHGSRWSDVPGEAMLKIGRPDAVLRDAWPALRADDAAGLRRLARLVDQRLRTDSIVDRAAVQPIVTLMLEDAAPWRWGEYAQDLLRDWLRAHIVADTPAGYSPRIQLRTRLLDTCSTADRQRAERRNADLHVRAALTPEQAEEEQWIRRNVLSGIRQVESGRRQRPEIPHEITDEIVIELLALLGPDLGDGGEAILRRVARDAPSMLAPAVEELLTDRALAGYGRGLLAHLTEAYYVDDEAIDWGLPHYGVRGHCSRSFGVVPLAAWCRGPFMSLLQSNFRDGVSVLNRLLNHAARARVRTHAHFHGTGPPLQDDAITRDMTALEITGARRMYVGDNQVWCWYRGTGEGPYPCLSALQALERVCDKLIEINIPIERLAAILLNGCENVAMVGLVVGLLVRHLEKANRLLDPYLTEPFIWHQEFGRILHERGMFAADSEGLVAPERRTWSLREAATAMVLRSTDERAEELRELGHRLVANAHRDIKSTQDTRDDKTTERGGDTNHSIEQELALVRAWASGLDRNRYRVQEVPGGRYIQAVPPENVVQALQRHSKHIESVSEAARLLVRYCPEPRKGGRKAIGPEEIKADVAVARKLIDDAPSSGRPDFWDAPALVAAAVLEANFMDGTDIPMDALSFGAATVLRIGGAETGPRPPEFEHSFFEQGADRTAARALPKLLLPRAVALRAVVGNGDERVAFDRAAGVGQRLARSVVNEVRLHLARGLDCVWTAPCSASGHCHHEVGLRIATETMHDCVVGPWEPGAQRREIVAPEEPVAASIAAVEGEFIVAYRLDAAIRALAPAAMADICVSQSARTLLLTLLAAQRRSLLSGENDSRDGRGTHTLASARALLTLAEHGDDAVIYEHLNAYTANSALLGTFLRGLSAAAEETPTRAATARRVWPALVHHVLNLIRGNCAAFRDHRYSDKTLACVIPNATLEHQYLCGEACEKAIAWWEPLAWSSEIEAWLEPAAGRAECVDQLVGFLGVLVADDQARTGLPWIAKLVLPNATSVAARALLLTDWLLDTRAAAVAVGRESLWQEVVDALVVAGVTRLAPHSQ